MSKPTRTDNPYNSGRQCPYCNGLTAYVDSKRVYGKSYGMIYLCMPCRAWVGVHKGTNIALGRLANAELREAKKEAHKYFDMIYQMQMMSRYKSYTWLSVMLKIPREETHIGYFDVELCRLTVLYSKQFMNDMRRLDLDFGAKPLTPYFDTTEK